VGTLLVTPKYSRDSVTPSSSLRVVMLSRLCVRSPGGDYPAGGGPWAAKVTPG
jgi:hypothetical protein